MSKGILLTGLLLLTTVAKATKLEDLERDVAVLANWLILLVGGSIGVAILVFGWLIARHYRRRKQARQREKAFYESL
jgi:positive regulator of sigma E activity